MNALYNGPDYEGAIKRARMRNADEVLGDLESGDLNLMKKINGFSEDFEFEVSDVIEKIKQDKMFRAHFAKDPRKQNIDEITALEWLQKNLPGVSQVEKLPTTGKNAYYVDVGGYIRKGSDLAKGDTPSKSLDFFWVVEGIEFYAVHKRTTDTGGAQDNVKREVEKIMRNFQQSPQTGVALAVLLDGDYWTSEKIQSVAKFARSEEPRSFALPTPQILPVILGQLD